MHLDHVSYAAGPDGLDATVQRLGAKLGAPFTDGGFHPRFGTRNFVSPLAGGRYVEVVERLQHPAADQAPFGRAVSQRTFGGGGWFAWVIAVKDITAIEQVLGRPSVEGHRQRPDGVDLWWRQLGVKDTLLDPLLPYFIEWQVPPGLHPGAAATADSPRVVAMELAGDPSVLTKVVTVLDDIDLRWVDGDPGIVAVHLETAKGTVRIV